MKKESKYILRRVIVGVLVALTLAFIQSCDVKAETYVMPDVGLQINNNTNYIYPIANTTSGSSYNIKVAVSEHQPAYFIIDMCTQGNYNDMEITNSSCTNSCIASGKVTTYLVGDSCTVYGYGGWHVLAQVRVSKYEIDPVSTYYQANSRIRFGGYSYNTAVQILDFYASDDDQITQLANGQKNYDDIKNSLNNINNSISSSTTMITNALDTFKNLMSSKQDETNQQLQDLNNNINDDNVDAQDSQIRDLVGNDSFKDKTGLSSIITAPISILNKMTQPCTPINLTIPYIDSDLSIPCMSTEVYPKFPSGFITTIAAVVNGFLVYRIIAALYAMIKNFKDPQDDKIEVVDL